VLSEAKLSTYRLEDGFEQVQFLSTRDLIKRYDRVHCVQADGFTKLFIANMATGEIAWIRLEK
jgi:hypothetical protein